MGKRRRRVVYGRTKRAVLDKLDAARQDKRSGQEPVAQRLRTSEWLDRWLTDTSPRSAPGHERPTRHAVENYIRPAVGLIHLATLTPADVERMGRDIRGRGLSVNTAKLAYRVLRASLSVAERHGIVQRNVAAIAAGPRSDDSAATDDVLSAEQAAAVMEAARGDRIGASRRCCSPSA